MVRTLSLMLPLGTLCPFFSLPDTEGQMVGLDSFKKRALLVMFICNHCPYVKHIVPELKKISWDYRNKGLDIVAINSNDVQKYPEDAPLHMKIFIEELGSPFPYLFDETQEVAKAFKAACTPDFFLFNEKRELVYRGRLDASTPGNGMVVTGEDLRGAIDNLLSGQRISPNQKESMGCNIKWK